MLYLECHTYYKETEAHLLFSGVCLLVVFFIFERRENIETCFYSSINMYFNAVL